MQKTVYTVNFSSYSATHEIQVQRPQTHETKINSFCSDIYSICVSVKVWRVVRYFTDDGDPSPSFVYTTITTLPHLHPSEYFRSRRKVCGMELRPSFDVFVVRELQSRHWRPGTNTLSVFSLSFITPLFSLPSLSFLSA